MAGTASYVLPATNLRKAEHTISSSNSLMNSKNATLPGVRPVGQGQLAHTGRPLPWLLPGQDGHDYGLVILGCDAPEHLFTACDDLDWAFASFANHALVDTRAL